MNDLFKVNQLSSTNASLEAALSAKSDEAQKAATELATLRVTKEKTQTAAPATAEIETELSAIKQKLSEKEKETSRLMEENERLSEQVRSKLFFHS